MTRVQIKKQFGKVNKVAIKNREESALFDEMILEYYGEKHYSDMDLDQVIECLHYGHGKMCFDEFDKIMIEINEEG